MEKDRNNPKVGDLVRIPSSIAGFGGQDGILMDTHGCLSNNTVLVGAMLVEVPIKEKLNVVASAGQYSVRINGKPTVPGVVFGVSNDGGKTAVAWRENIQDAFDYLSKQNSGGVDSFYVVAVKFNNDRIPLNSFLNSYPDDASSWEQADEVLKDVALLAANALSNDQDVIVHRGHLFLDSDSPSEWNTKGKTFIRYCVDLMTPRTFNSFITKFKDTVGYDNN